MYGVIVRQPRLARLRQLFVIGQDHCEGVHKSQITACVSENIQELAHNGGAGHFHENNVIQSDTVVRVEKCKAALDLMSLNHGFKNILDSQWLALTGKMVCDGKNGS
jgi:hypothetical protein